MLFTGVFFTYFVANCDAFFLLFYTFEHILSLTSYDIIIQHMVSFALYIVLHAHDLLCLQLDAFVPLTANCSIGFLQITIRYWDTRQLNPVHTQHLPDRCYSFTVRHPLMVVGTADHNLIVFNLQNPQVTFSSNEINQ